MAISDAAEKIGLQSTGLQLGLDQLKKINLPCIIHWQQDHFVVLYKIKNDIYFFADPAIGLIRKNENDFKKNWYSHMEVEAGIALSLIPSPQFHDLISAPEHKQSWYSIFRYVNTYKRLFIQLVLGLIAGTIISLIMPFLTQLIVDNGINTRNVQFIYIIFIAQLMLFIGSTSIEFIRSWVVLFISTRINISILTDFLIKLMKLPISFFETKTIGDIMQRMTDQQTIESFLTGSTLNTLFSILNLIVFTIVLIYYNSTIFFVSFLSSICTAIWILIFLKRRRILNYQQFENESRNQSSLVELVTGMQEIKLNNCERQK